jgi:uncharacterized protein involved in exopolysaccharide biosynthesis
MTKRGAEAEPMDGEIISGGPPLGGSGTLDQKTLVGSPSVAALVRRHIAADAELLVCMGPRVGERFPLHREILLGRSESADVVLADERVSGRHCQVIRTGQGYRVKDLGSSNGTLVNAQKVQEADLRDGDLLQVGYTVFKFVVNAAQAGFSVERFSDPEVLGPANTPPTPAPPQVIVNNVAQQNVDEDMSLAEMVGTVRRVVDFFFPYRFVIAISFAVGAVLGVGSFFAKPPGSKAAFDLNISSSVDKTTGNALADRGSAAESAFRSDALVLKSLNDVGIAAPGNDLLGVVQRNLTFTSPDAGSWMAKPVLRYHGEFLGETPEFTGAFLTTHLKNFVDSEVDRTTQLITAKLKYTTEQLTKAETDMRASDEELRAFKSKFLASLPQNAAKSQEFVFDLQQSQNELSSSIEQIRLEIQSASVTVTGSASKKQKAISAVQEEIAAAKSSGLGDNHPDVVALKAKLTRIEASADDGPIGRSGDKSLSQLRAELASKTLRLAETNKQLDAAKAAIASMPDFEARYADLTRSDDTNKRQFNRLSEEKLMAETQLGFEKTAAVQRFEVISPPRVEAPAVGKQLIKRVVMGAVAGLLLGIAYAVWKQLKHIWRTT